MQQVLWGDQECVRACAAVCWAVWVYLLGLAVGWHALPGFVLQPVSWFVRVGFVVLGPWSSWRERPCDCYCFTW